MMMWVAAFMLGSSSAAQDIVIDAYRIESAEPELQGMMAAAYITGYRIAMLLTGAGALFLVDWFGSANGAYSYQAWQYTYALMAAAMLIGVITTLVIKETQTPNSANYLGGRDFLGLVLLYVFAIAGFFGFYSVSSEIAMQWRGVLVESRWQSNPVGFAD